MEADVVPDVLWPCLSECVAQHTGLAFPGQRRTDLQRGLAAASRELGFPDATACAEMLLAESLTRPQLAVVASHLTIGETYFFRDEKTFDALADHVLPELIGRRRGRGQHLRLWSAACSTGEEPYSLAILVRRLLPDWRDWNVSILATDINQRSLERAVAGVYGDWSFRGAAPGFKDRYFTPTSNGRFEIDQEIKGLVSFAHLNLAQESLRTPAANTHEIDVILCRNVLIYFTESHTRRLADNLHMALAEGGWLAVSASECSQTLFSSFTAVNFPGAILYRKCRADEQGGEAWRAPSDASPDLDAAVEPAAATATATAAAAAAAATWPEPLAALPDQAAPIYAAPAQAPEAISLQTRALANQGRHADALASIEQWLASDKTDPSAYYVRAMILQEIGERHAARDSLHQAIYLQPDFALAYFALGNLARADAQTAQAHKHFANALQLLRRCAPGSTPPESDGLSAGRLVEIITTLLGQPDRPTTPAGSPE